MRDACESTNCNCCNPPHRLKLLVPVRMLAVRHIALRPVVRSRVLLEANTTQHNTTQQQVKYMSHKLET